MDPRHLLRGWGSMKIIAFAPLALTATLACTPPDEPARSNPADEPVESVTASARPAAASTSSSFTLFESGQVRPLALSQDRQHLFAVNTPDNRLEVFRVGDDRLRHVASIPVGLEPVAVAVRNQHE